MEEPPCTVINSRCRVQAAQIKLMAIFSKGRALKWVTVKHCRCEAHTSSPLGYLYPHCMYVENSTGEYKA